MDTRDPPSSANTHLTWFDVALAFGFIVFDGVLSGLFGLKVGTSLMIAALRCVGQLALMALVLKLVFETKNPWAVAGVAGVLGSMRCSVQMTMHAQL